MITVALVGRPNVGKSTLINRLIGRPVAIVHDEPGVTRDWKDVYTTWDGQDICLIDTPGMDLYSKTTLAKDMMRATLNGIAESDLVIFIVDAAEGISEEDKEYFRRLKKEQKPVFLIKNKADIRGNTSDDIHDADLILSLSARTGHGIAALKEDILKRNTKDILEIQKPEDTLKIALLGRPNAGKSTLLNALLGYERTLTGELPGMTRDTIHATKVISGNTFRLSDTAGLRKKKAHRDVIEHKAASETKHAMDFCHIAIVVVDAVQGIEKQDLSIVSDALSEGRPVIMALNKWDLVPDDQKKQITQYLKKQSSILFHDVAELPVVYLSAKQGEGVAQLFQKSRTLYDLWNKRVPTALLNQWLGYATTHHPPPVVKSRRIRLKYATQASTRPPTFVIFTTRSDEVPPDYLRYLRKSLAENLKLGPIPLRIILRTRDNPFDTRGKKG
jgi:GTP-binding protein